jgi:hypothetical protein
MKMYCSNTKDARVLLEIDSSLEVIKGLVYMRTVILKAVVAALFNCVSGVQ